MLMIAQVYLMTNQILNPNWAKRCRLVHLIRLLFISKSVAK